LQNPVVSNSEVQGFPQRWKLRTVTLQTVYGGELFTRREVVCNSNHPIFVGLQNSLIIQGVLWRVVARSGEYRRGPYNT